MSEVINWEKIFKEFKGSWIALKDDQKTVISSAKTAEKALEKAQKEGYEEPILMRVPKKDTAFVGCLLDKYEVSI